ncbi:helix-turn-helix domain-containing protein [Bacillus cereus]|uniref:helix-turn-helix domain-containing protein n=1 Tax=Bacillus cereus TaxID=1396 RepID=UPI002405826B|nr:helix-turn-helix domain-containing protein [Bacillus cereus]MDF9524313.1 helix-turn-helix domain-containing protein [Bacillus cereus]MDF9563092.1 helix-turn-helix domain-containing protein [Bacillus cereus]
MKAERIFEGTSADGIWNKAIFKVKEGSYYYISENSTIEVTDNEYLNVEVLEEVHQGEDHNLFAIKGDERDMLQQLEMDRFNFEDVEWGDLNLLDNEIMSSTDAIEEWGIESSTLRKRINDFPKGSIRKIGTTYAVTRFGMRCVFGSNKK